MAVSLKLADAFVDLTVNRSQFNAGLAIAIAQLGQLKGLGVVNLSLNRSMADASLLIFEQHMRAAGAAARFTATLDRSQATASLNLLMQQMQAARGLAGGRMGGFGGGGGGGGGGFGGGGLGSGITGLAQGLGIAGFAANPAMMAGQLIGSGLKDAVGTAMDLESTFVGLQRVSGESAANVDRFKQSIFDIGKSQAGVSIKDLTDISMAGAKAGITDKEGLAGLETFTRGMAKVRNSIQGMGTEQLANDMTRMLNLFHKGTDYVESFGSVLARMDNVSTSSAADILDMSKSLSGTFSSLNMGIPQVMAFSSVLADVGLTNQQGASSFSQILRMLASQSEKMATLIGVPIDVFQEKVRTDAMGALGMLIGKFKEINEVDPIKAQEFLVSLGFRGVKTAGALQQLSSMFDQVKERTKMAIEEESTLGSLQAANALNSKTTEGAVQKLKNAFTELGDAIGSNLLKPISETAAAAAALTRSLAGVTPPAVSALQAAGGLASGLASPESNAKHLADVMVAVENNPAIMGRIKGAIDVAAGGMASMVLPTAAGTDVLGRGIARIMGTPEAGAPGAFVGPPRPDLRGDRAKALAAVAAENERRQAEAERLRRERFLPTAADRARAEEEVGPAKAGAKGEVAEKDQKEHDEAVFRHAQRLQGERLGKDFGENIVQGGDAENNARLLGKKIAFFGQMALGAMIASPEKKLETAAGLAGRGAGALVDAAGRPLAGAGKALAGLGPDEIDEKKLKEKKKIESQMFTDAAAYSTDAIQKALTGADKTPAEHLKAAKASEGHLREIKEALKSPRQNQGGGAPVFTKP